MEVNHKDRNLVAENLNKPDSDRADQVASTAPWTFLSNHAHVLILLDMEPGLVLREVAARVGITERAVQRIVQELEVEGFLKREKVGRCNQYEINRSNHMRHPVEAHCTIAQFLDLIKNSRPDVSQAEE